MSGIVLVGGGVATAATAAGLRAAGFDGAVTLITDEPHLPYERPPLSKEYLAGTFAHADFQVNPDAWYAENDVDVLLGARAEEIDSDARTVSLADGSALSYDSLVIGTGARAKTLAGFESERVHVLRNLADADRLGSRLQPGTRLAVIGAGFVGCELAAVAAGRGAHVVVFGPGALPLPVLGPEIGEVILGVHREQGIEMRVGELVTAMRDAGAGVVLSLDSGRTLECDEVLVGIGSVPNTELAATAGAEIDGGVVTDVFGRTSVPDIYAIGDVASRFHPVYERRVRVEHHDTAQRHGAALAKTLVGQGEPFAEEHYFWSHQYAHNLQSIGMFGPSDARVVRGDPADRSFSVFALRDGRIRAMVSMDRPQDLLQVRKLLTISHEVTAAQLADPTFPLKDLLPQRTRRTPMEVR